LFFKIKMGKTIIALALLVMAIVAVESKAIEKPESISGTKKSSKLPANPPDGKLGGFNWIHYGDPPKGKKENNPPGKLGWIFRDPPKGNLGWIFRDPPKENAEKTLLAYVKAHPAEVKQLDSKLMAYIKAHPEQVKKFMSEVKAKGPAIEAYIKAHPEQAKKFFSALHAKMAQGNLGEIYAPFGDTPKDNPEEVRDSLAKVIRDLPSPVKDAIRSVRRRLEA